jgi:hypothetical protein
MKFSFQTPKNILSLLLVIILSIGTISIIANAADDKPLLETFFDAVSVSEDKIDVSGELCLNDECVDSLSSGAWEESDNNISFSGGSVTIGEPTSSVNVAIRTNIIEGIGTVNTGRSKQPTFGADYVVVTDNTGADFSGVQAGDTFILEFIQGSDEGTVRNVVSNQEVEVWTKHNYTTRHTNIGWSYLPLNSISVQDKSENDLFTVSSKGDVKIKGELTVDGQLTVPSPTITTYGPAHSSNNCSSSNNGDGIDWADVKNDVRVSCGKHKFCSLSTRARRSGKDHRGWSECKLEYESSTGEWYLEACSQTGHEANYCYVTCFDD